MKQKVEYKSIEIKSEQLNYNIESDELKINAHAAVFDVEDELGLSFNPETKSFVEARDIIHKGAFTKTLEERKSRIKFCKNHNLNDPVGTPIDILEDEIGLYTESKFSAAEKDLQTKVREGIFNEMSIGYVATKVSFEKKSDGTWIRHIWEMKLYEYSIVTLGRNEFAKVTELKSVEDAITIVENLINKEKNEEKKYDLLRLKSLIEGEPAQPLIPQEPIQEKKEVGFDFSKLEFE